MARFLDLNEELANLVTARLGFADLCSLRQTSRECYEKTFRQFALRVRNLSFLVAKRSLDTLLSIAKHDRLGKAVKTVRLSSYYLNDSAYDMFDMDLHLAKTSEERRMIKTREKRYKAMLRKQEAFAGNSKAVESLRTVLSKLLNLEEIEIGEWYCERFSYRTERPFGLIEGGGDLKSLYTQNALIQVKENEVLGLQNTFTVALRALMTHVKPINSLSAHCWDGDNPIKMSHISAKELAHAIPIVGYSGFRIALQGLRSLSLAVSFFEDDQTGDDTSWRTWLPKFVSLPSQLENLSLTLMAGAGTTLESVLGPMEPRSACLSTTYSSHTSRSWSLCILS